MKKSNLKITIIFVSILFSEVLIFGVSVYYINYWGSGTTLYGKLLLKKEQLIKENIRLRIELAKGNSIENFK